MSSILIFDGDCAACDRVARELIGVPGIELVAASSSKGAKPNRGQSQPLVEQDRVGSSLMSSLQTVISGSYRKHFAHMLILKECLQEARIRVLAPVSSEQLNAGEEFIILNADPVSDPRTLQDSIFAMIRTTTFLVVANVGGYLGNAAVLEIGYALAQGNQILTVEPVAAPNLGAYTRELGSVFPEIVRSYRDQVAMQGI